MKDLNIVFLNYFCKDDIVQAIESLMVDLKDSTYDVQITVADNSENKDKIREEISRRFPGVRYVNCAGNIGFGAGNVRGFQSCEARYYFALNRDTIILPHSQTIDRLIKYMDAHPQIGCIGPKLINMDSSLQYTCYRFDFRSIAELLDKAEGRHD